VIRSCIELGENNPIVSIHDQVTAAYHFIVTSFVQFLTDLFPFFLTHHLSSLTLPFPLTLTHSTIHPLPLSNSHSRSHFLPLTFPSSPLSYYTKSLNYPPCPFVLLPLIHSPTPFYFTSSQGAGGNGNVLKEIVDPKGARFELRAIPVGDPTLSALEVSTSCLHPCVSIQHCASKGAPTTTITLLLLSHTNPLPLNLSFFPFTQHFPLHSLFPLLLPLLLLLLTPPLPSSSNPSLYRSGVPNIKRTMRSWSPLKTCQSSWPWARERIALSVL
jgi:hypothetical protein